MKLIFFLIPLAILFSSPFFESGNNIAEPQLLTNFKGKNFDVAYRGQNESGEHQWTWTSSPERILDGWQWKDWIHEDNSTFIRFESKAVSFEFDKDSCTFLLYEPGKVSPREQPIIDSMSSVVRRALDKTDDWKDMKHRGCTTSVEQLKDGIVITAISTIHEIEFKRIYELDWKAGLEWTNEITHKNRTHGGFKYGVVDVCTGCGNLFIDGVNQTVRGDVDYNKTEFVNRVIEVNNEYYYDPKNEQHDALWAVKQRDNELIFDFTDAKAPLGLNQTLRIDPTFTSNTPTTHGWWGDDDQDGTCEQTITTGMKNVGPPDPLWIGLVSNAGANEDCRMGGFEWDISSLPSDINGVTSTKFKWETRSLTGSGQANCDFYSILNDQPSVASEVDVWNDASSGTEYVNADTQCVSTGTNYEVTLGSSANTDVLNQAPGGWFAIGVFGDGDWGSATDASNHLVGFASTASSSPTPAPTLEIEYTTGAPKPDAITNLSASNIQHNKLDLSWTQPNLNTGNLTGYQINQTGPPHGEPLTILVNATTDISLSVTGLTQLTNYSFRGSPWTEGGTNDTGNILNITTPKDFSIANFTPGSFDVNVTNDDILAILFEEIDVNTTTKRLNVTFPNTLNNLKCDFDFQFAQLNHTYGDLDSIAVTSERNETSFVFTNVTNEIIDVYCWDGGSSGTYIITQDEIPLVQQIIDFRSGEFGTEGAFGAIDIVGLLVVIFAMIGFNRVNESVGAMVAIMLTGVLAWFEIISLPSVIFAGIAVVTMLIVASTRKQ